MSACSGQAWPGRVTGPGGLRSQFTHVIDVAPTVLDVAGIPVPSSVDGVDQEPMHGVSFAGTLTDPAAPEWHTQRYFETIGNRAMYKDGWWLGPAHATDPLGRRVLIIGDDCLVGLDAAAIGRQLLIWPNGVAHPQV